MSEIFNHSFASLHALHGLHFYIFIFLRWTCVCCMVV